MEKAIKALALLIMMICCLSEPSFAENWQFLSSSGGNSYYYDKDSLEREGHLAFFSTKLVYSIPQESDQGRVAAEEDEWDMDCSNKLYKIVISRDLDEQGNIINSGMGSFEELKPIEPGSFMETLYRNVCPP